MLASHMDVVWTVLICAWLAVAGYRYRAWAQRKKAKESAFLTEAFTEAYAIKRQREAEERARRAAN